MIEEVIKRALREEKEEEERFVSPSTLSKLCLKACSFELLGIPKPEPSPQRKMFMEAGIEGHRRVIRHLAKICPMREVFFEVREYKVRGYADAIIYTPNDGFYVLEVKTIGSFDFERIRAQGPREDHVMQLLCYLWGLERYYGISLRGGVILYENRDSLEHLVFFQDKDLGRILPFLEKLKILSPSLDVPGLPKDHPSHKYCPYLEICEGEKEIEVPKEKFIAKAVVRRMAGGVKKEKRKKKGLLELAQSLGWEEERRLL